MSMVAFANGAGAMVPSRSAEQLAEHMLGAEGVQRAILEETIDSAEEGRAQEAGRTACGSIDNVRAPVARFPRAVELSECPATDAVGIWHTHPDGNELRRPRHSLPDWGNVVFGWADASVVTGTEQSQAIVASGDREAMLATFQDALGLPVSTKRGIVAAVITGDIPDYFRALDHVESAMGQFVRQRANYFPDLDARLDGLTVEPGHGRTPAHRPTGNLHCHQFDELLSPDVANLRADARDAKDFFVMAGQRAARQGFDEAIGIVVGTIISNRIFNR